MVLLECFDQPSSTELCTVRNLLPDSMLLLTHLPLDRVAAILADDILKRLLVNENIRISIQISLKSVPKCSIDNKPALVQVMAWRQAITWSNADPVYRRIYAALGGDELTHSHLNKVACFKCSFIRCWYFSQDFINDVP